MKKYLFLAVSILSIFFVTNKVDALSMSVNGVETEVTEENLIYYLYNEFPDYFSYDYFYLFYTGNSTIPYKFYSCTLNAPVYSLGSWYLGRNTSSSNTNTCNIIEMYGSSSTFGLSVASKSLDKIYTSRIKVSNYSGVKPLFSNEEFSSSTAYILLSKQDLIDYFGVKPTYKITYYLNNEIYKEIEVEEGSSHKLLDYDYNDNTHKFTGWQYDKNIDLNNITSNITINATLEEKEVIPVYIEFPITKTEFYALLVEVGILIMIIFLKWCFPFKGGTDLR